PPGNPGRPGVPGRAAAASPRRARAGGAAPAGGADESRLPGDGPARRGPVPTSSGDAGPTAATPPATRGGAERRRPTVLPGSRGTPRRHGSRRSGSGWHALSLRRAWAAATTPSEDSGRATHRPSPALRASERNRDEQRSERDRESP